MKSFFIVFAEAVLVGILLLGLVEVLKISRGTHSSLSEIPEWAIILVAGITFHLMFEYTGLNKMYVDAYYKF
jgi:hypothetical protein